MTFDLLLSDNIGLKIASGHTPSNGYPTARIQKGWLLSCDGCDLSEEAVGFGVPVLKRGLQTIFPGEAELSADDHQSLRVHARFHLNLEERITRQGKRTIDNPLLYKSKNFMAGMIRGFPALRRALTGASNLLRDSLGWHTTYEKSDFSAEIQLVYTIFPGENRLMVELAGLESSPDHITEIVIMNEQGAHHFDEYQDGSGIKSGAQIGCWDEVTGASATFHSRNSRLSFTLPRVDGAQLYHGRELIGSRLAWAGFGYSIPPGRQGFQYDVTMRRLP